MKYIIRNLIHFIKNQTNIFIFTMLAIVSSVILLHFSYSMYQSFMKNREAEEYEKDFISVTLNDKYKKYDENEENGIYKIKKKENQTYLTFQDLKKVIKNLSDSFQKELNCVGTQCCVADVPLSFYFSVENNEIVKSEDYENNMKSNSLLTEGRFFTEEEYSDGLPVAIVFDPDADINTEFSDSILSPDGTKIHMDGTEYDVIGKQGLYPDQPVIPITCLPDTATLYGFISFDFDSPVNSAEYEEIKENVETYFGEHATVEEVQLPDKDKIYLYNTMIIIAVLIAIVSALNFGILYQYLLKIRQEEIRAMLICGLKKRKAVFLFVTECVFLTVPAYIVSVVLYDRFLLKVLSGFFENVEEHYSFLLYALLFIIYYFSSILVLTGSILHSFRKEKRMQIGGGCE